MGGAERTPLAGEEAAAGKVTGRRGSKITGPHLNESWASDLPVSLVIFKFIIVFCLLAGAGGLGGGLYTRSAQQQQANFASAWSTVMATLGETGSRALQADRTRQGAGPAGDVAACFWWIHNGVPHADSDG